MRDPGMPYEDREFSENKVLVVLYRKCVWQIPVRTLLSVGISIKIIQSQLFIELCRVRLSK